MSSDEIAIRVRDVAKHFLLFDRPQDRLKQSIVPRLQRLVGRPPTRYYREFAALSGVSFDVRRGETVGIVGRNGSGKSTLLQIVCGTLRPNGGSVAANGRIAALLELGAGFNPQFTGRENVYLNGAILGLPRGEIDERFDAICRFADIGSFIDQPVKTYSSGMYMRLAFATATNVDPDILVVDEALSVGDEAFQRKCFARIEAIKERGGTILFVTHSAQSVVQLCSRAILMDRGEMILDGRPKLVTLQYQRLINACPSVAPVIRDSIVRLGRDESRATAEVEEGVSERSLAPASRSGVDEIRSLQTMLDDANEEYYDPTIVPTTGFDFEERGARIRDVRILGSDGKSVNMLRLGRRYRLLCTVEFREPSKHTGFGFSIRNKAGIVVSGYVTNRGEISNSIQAAAGEAYTVSFEFSNIFTSTVFFINIGVFGGDSGRVLMARAGDCASFKTLASDSDLCASGFADVSVLASQDRIDATDSNNDMGVISGIATIKAQP